MRTVFLSVLIPLLLLGAPPAVAQLPPEIQADFHLLRAEQAIGESDTARAMVEFDKIVLLQKEHELDLPDEFHFRYAQVASAADLPEQAHEAVVKYLTVAGREGRHYEEALQLMNQVHGAIEASKESQEASNEPSPPPQETSQFTSAGQLGTGGTPERQEDMRTLANVVAPAEEQPAPEPETAPVNQAQRQTATQAVDCTKKWKKYRSWKTATDADVAACLAAGADVNERGYLKTKPLHWAAEYSSDPNIIKALVAAGASLEARNKYDRTPLHYAAQYSSNPEIINTLVEGGANLEARDRGQWTPLHRAAYWNKNPEVIQALVDAGANPNARNRMGEKPMDIARKRNRRILAAAGGTWTQKSAGSGGLGALIAGAAVVGVGATSGASTESILAGVEAVASSQHAATGGGQQTAVQNPAGTAGSAAGGGSCLIPGYPRPPGGVANLGLSWCPASVSMQLRAFALQAAGAQCAIATGSSSTPEQIQARRREIAAACERLAALGVSNCRCPAGYGP